MSQSAAHFPAPVRPRLGAAALALLLMAAACEGRLGYRSDAANQTSFPVTADLHTVRLTVPSGAVTIWPGEPGVVVARTVTRRMADTEQGLAALAELDVALRAVPAEPGVLSLHAADVPSHLDPAQHKVITKTVLRVPAQLAVEGITGFGSMAVHDWRGAVALDTGRGTVFIQNCHGDVRVRSGGGVVMIDGHRGGADVESRECPSIQAFFDEIGATGIRLVTTIGSIQAHVPADAAFTLDARTSKGRAKNGFEVPVVALPGIDGGKLMRGAVAGGGPAVHLEVREEGNVAVAARPKR